MQIVDHCLCLRLSLSLSPSDQKRDLLYLLKQASQASPRLRSTETQATGTVCFVARLSAASVLQSTMPTPTAPTVFKALSQTLSYAILGFPTAIFDESIEV